MDYPRITNSVIPEIACSLRKGMIRDLYKPLGLPKDPSRYLHRDHTSAGMACQVIDFEWLSPIKQWDIPPCVEDLLEP